LKEACRFAAQEEEETQIGNLIRSGKLARRDSQ